MFINNRETVFILILFLIVMIVMNSFQTYSIYKRNENDYPRTITYSYQDLLRDLQKLRELNDPEINRYLDEIENAIRIGDYNKLLELLRLLEQYLSLRGYASDENNYISILAKLLRAIEKAGPFGLEINVEILDPYLRKLIEYASLREFLLSINIEKILSLIQRFGLDFTGDLFPQISSDGGEGSPGGIQLPGSKPPPVPNIFVGFPVLGFNIPMFVLILIPVALAAVLLVLFIKKKKLSLGLLSDFENTISSSFRRLTRSFREISLDPVIVLYNKWYFLTKIKGYRRSSYETLREYLNRISESELSSIGEIVTNMYEDRVYGDKVISRESLSSVEEILSRVESKER